MPACSPASTDANRCGVAPTGTRSHASGPNPPRASISYSTKAKPVARASSARLRPSRSAYSWTSGATFAQFLANTVSHELAHTIGLNDSYRNLAGGGATNINPPNDVLSAMEKQMRAEREKRAVVLTSEGERDANINQAEGEKQRVIKESEAAK